MAWESSTLRKVSLWDSQGVRGDMLLWDLGEGEEKKVGRNWEASGGSGKCAGAPQSSCRAESGPEGHPRGSFPAASSRKPSVPTPALHDWPSLQAPKTTPPPAIALAKPSTNPPTLLLL